MRLRAFVGVLLALAGFALAGCGGSGSSDESRIRGRYAEWARAMEAERVDRYMLLFSPNYLDNGWTYSDIRIAAAETFDQYEIEAVRYRFHDIRISGNYANVWLTEEIDVIDTFDYNRPKLLTTEAEDIWRYEAGKWYLYGNQQSGLAKGADRNPASFRHSKENLRLNAKPNP